ncbi:MAG: hypothetical protein ABEK00_02000 [Candidatus Nanohaloarchaea archaeon]
MRKGLSGVMVMAIVSLFVLGLIITVTYGGTGGSLDFVKAQKVSLQTQRITNAMLAMQTMPAGHIALEMDEYQIRYDKNDRNLTLNYSGKLGSDVIEKYLVNYDRIIAPQTFEPINGSLCIQKYHDSGTVMVLNNSGCPK